MVFVGCVGEFTREILHFVYLSHRTTCKCLLSFNRAYLETGPSKFDGHFSNGFDTITVSNYSLQFSLSSGIDFCH